MPTPDFPPPKGPGDWPTPVIDVYHTASGAFLQSYASAEAGLLWMIDRYAGGLLAEDVNRGTPPSEFWARTRRQMDVVRALVGSQRSADIAAMIKLLMRVADSPPEARKIADEALGHFGNIGIIRNRLMHSGSAPFYDKQWLFRTWNGHEVKERPKALDFVFTIEDLENMTADLRSIRLRIGVVTITDEPGIAGLAEQYEAFHPWLYKQIQPVAPDHTQKRILQSGHPLPQSPFEAAFAIAASYPLMEIGPLMHVGPKRT